MRTHQGHQWLKVIDEVINSGETAYSSDPFRGYGGPLAIMVFYVAGNGGAETSITINGVQASFNGSAYAFYSRDNGIAHNINVTLLRSGGDQEVVFHPHVLHQGSTLVPNPLLVSGPYNRVRVTVQGNGNGTSNFQLYVNTGGGL